MNNITYKPIYIESPTIKHWSGLCRMIQLLRNNEVLYLYNLLMIAVLYGENKRLMRPLTKHELCAIFPCSQPVFNKNLNLCLERGLIENLRNANEGKRGKRTAFKLSYTLKGELLLKKYEKILEGLTEQY